MLFFDSTFNGRLIAMVPSPAIERASTSNKNNRSLHAQHIVHVSMCVFSICYRLFDCGYLFVSKHIRFFIDARNKLSPGYLFRILRSFSAVSGPISTIIRQRQHFLSSLSMFCTLNRCDCTSQLFWMTNYLILYQRNSTSCFLFYVLI